MATTTPDASPAKIPLKWTEDFLLWLRFANAGHYNAGNIPAMDHAIEHMPEGPPMLEIGSFAGLSTNQIAALRRRHGRTTRLITCDPWSFEGIDMNVRVGGHPFTFHEYADYIKQTYINNVSFFSRDNPPATAQLTADEFFRAWDERREVTDVVSGRPLRLGGPIAFCFIDGDHTYDAARRDFENTDRHLVRGGYVLFDDSGDGVNGPDGKPWGSWRVAKEVEKSGRYEMVMKCPNYLFRKK